MSFDDAVSALDGAMQSDFSGEPAAPAAPAPVEQAPIAPATPEGTVPAPTVQPGQLRNPDGTFAPAAPAQVTEPAVDTFDGGQFNPDTLPPELQAGWKQLQGAFTKSTQGLAEQRRQIESLGDLNEVRQAAELYRALQDPGYLQEFHGELTRALEAQGLSTGQARTEAARQIEGATAPTQPISDALARLKDDPELAPVADTLQSLETRLASFEQQQVQREEAQRVATQQMQMAGELQRQEMAILQANPHYTTAETVAAGTPNDMDAIYELSAFFDGNLLAAQQRYEQLMTSRLERYLASKQAPTPASAPVQGTGTSEIPVQPNDLQEAYRAALGHLAEAGIDTLA